ncbi:hypothetical protein QZH41_016660, partial [Actinostola sp. cb2023]
IQYSSNKKMKLALEYFSGSDELTKRLLLEISNIGKFIKRAAELYGLKIDAETNETIPNNPKRKGPRRTSSPPPRPSPPLSAEVNVNRAHVQEDSNSQPENSPSSSKRKDCGSTSSLPSAKRNRQPPSNVQQEDSQPREVDVENSTAQFSDEVLPFLINQNLVPCKVLVTNLKQPRQEFLLREIDEVFVAALKNEFQENKSIFMKPLLVAVKELKSTSDFDQERLDSYELEVIGGNHRRAALQQLFQEYQKEQYKWANVLLFCEMPKTITLKLAASHNRMDGFCHHMTTQDKVNLCHKLLKDDFNGAKSTNWRKYCAELLNTSKDALEFIFLLSGFEDRAFEALLKVFEAFERLGLKEQSMSAKQTKRIVAGACQKQNLVASKFKCLRNLPTDDTTRFLTEIGNGKLSFKELKEIANTSKALACLRDEFTKLVGANSWQEIQQRFPIWCSDEKLKPFVKGTKNGKPDKAFKAFIQRVLNTEKSTETDVGLEGLVITNPESLTWYSAIKMSSEWKVSPTLFERLQFRGADVIFIQNEKDWNDSMVKAIIRAVCSLNTRHKQSQYIIAVRKEMSIDLTECTPNGKQDTMHVVSPKQKPQKGNLYHVWFSNENNLFAFAF